VRKLSLRPYHGTIWLCDSMEELHKAYKREVKKPYGYIGDDPKGGRFVLLEGKGLVDRVFLVYGHKLAHVAHEFAHVLLIVFETIGHDPRKGDGEPFCYMLSQLLLEAE
jgi:hypothetical protein